MIEFHRTDVAGESSYPDPLSTWTNMMKRHPMLFEGDPYVLEKELLIISTSETYKCNAYRKEINSQPHKEGFRVIKCRVK